MNDSHFGYRLRHEFRNSQRVARLEFISAMRGVVHESKYFISQHDRCCTVKDTRPSQI